MTVLLRVALHGIHGERIALVWIRVLQELNKARKVELGSFIRVQRGRALGTPPHFVVRMQFFQTHCPLTMITQIQLAVKSNAVLQLPTLFRLRIVTVTIQSTAFTSPSPGCKNRALFKLLTTM